MSIITNIIKNTIENKNFRKVIFTGSMSQLVVMNIGVGEDIGKENHARVEQSFFVVQGMAKVSLDGKDSKIEKGAVVIVTPGTEHNIVNIGTEPLLIYTVYTPPNHLEGRVHKTKTDARNDADDEKFGKKVNQKK